MAAEICTASVYCNSSQQAVTRAVKLHRLMLLVGRIWMYLFTHREHLLCHVGGRYTSSSYPERGTLSSSVQSSCSSLIVPAKVISISIFAAKIAKAAGPQLLQLTNCAARTTVCNPKLAARYAWLASTSWVSKT